ncbi:MAG: lamin tail domain-containing protein, partial [Planctomycetota bacterium]
MFGIGSRLQGVGCLVSTVVLLAMGSLNAAVVVSEIMYNSPGGSELEYLELHNTGPGAVSLEGWRVDGGVRLTLPAATIAEGGFVVLAFDHVVRLFGVPS